MRTLLALLILAVALLIVAVGTGMVDIRQTESARLPDVSVAEDGISADGARQPAFDVETGTIAVGSETRAVTVPTLEVEPAQEESADEEVADSPTG